MISFKNRKIPMIIITMFALTLIVFMFIYTKNNTCIFNHHFQTATCQNPNICSLCNYSEGDVLPHNFFKDSEISATCINEGKVVYNCQMCGMSKTENIPMTSHAFVEKNTVNNNCVKEGYILYECSVCQMQKKEEIPAKNHSISNGKCINCNSDFKAKKNEFLSEINRNSDWLDGVTSYAYTQSDLNSITGEELHRWDKLLNKIYQYLKQIMPQSEFDELQKDESKWVENKERSVKKFANECSLGSAATMEINSYESRLTEERCYYLLSQLDKYIQ